MGAWGEGCQGLDTLKVLGRGINSRLAAEEGGEMELERGKRTSRGGRLMLAVGGGGTAQRGKVRGRDGGQRDGASGVWGWGEGSKCQQWRG